MFNSNGKENGTTKLSKNGSAGSSSVNLIGVGTKIEGEIQSEGDIRIDGKIKGTIASKAKIVIGNTGTINGDIVCENADVSGKIDGKIEVSGLLFLKGNSEIRGDITTSKLVVEAGAVFNGSCSMGAKQAKNEEGITQALEKATA